MFKKTRQCKPHGSIHAAHCLWKSPERVKGQIKGRKQKKVPKPCSFRTFAGSGRRIRTLTYGVRVRCATITQSRYIAPLAEPCRSANKCYYSRNFAFVNRKFSKKSKNGEFPFFLPLCHIQIANSRSSGSNTRRRTLRFAHSSAVTRWLWSTILSISSSSDSIIDAP